MRLEEVGEFGLIARLEERVKEGWKGTSWRVAIGDDAAVWEEADGSLRVWTADLLVEGVHFLATVAMEDVGWKALAVNLSDLAAMGARPLGALVTLALPPQRSVEEVEALYRGLMLCGQRFACPIVGGDITRSPGPLVVDGTVWGETTPSRLRLRSKAQVGDWVAVTGTLGDSAAGLYRLLHPEAPPSLGEERLLQAHLRPWPRLEEAQCLVEEPGVHALIDLSDGVAGDAGHIAARSRVAIRLEVEALPLSEEARRASSLWGCDPLEWALQGGEDYELLFTCSPSCWDDLARRLQATTGTLITPIGEVTALHPQGQVWLASQGRPQRLLRGGYAHF